MLSLLEGAVMFFLNQGAILLVDPANFLSLTPDSTISDCYTSMPFIYENIILSGKTDENLEENSLNRKPDRTKQLIFN